MAKGRMLNRTIAYDKKINQLTITEQWLYMRLLPFVDDEGKLNGDVDELKLMALPGAAITGTKILTILRKLKDIELIEMNEGVVIQYKGWSKNQKIGHNPAKSVYPDIIKDTEEGRESSGKVKEATNNITKYNITESNINIPFTQFWDLYDKKRGKANSEKKWHSLTDYERELIVVYIPKYIKSEPNKQYRKDPSTFLNQRAWEDELLKKEEMKGYCPNQECNSYNQDRIMYKETDKCVYCGWELKGRV